VSVARKAAPVLAVALVAAALAGCKQAHCPADAANCAVASGTITYIEAHDPDGEGDAHFVLLSRESITAPGVSVIDVEPALRPHPLPALGAYVSAAGPVYRGSYGQKQIEATVLHVAGG
jgi:hypothetical protein